MSSFSGLAIVLVELEHLQLYDVTIKAGSGSLHELPSSEIALPRLRILKLISPITLRLSFCDSYLDLLSNLRIPRATRVEIELGYHGTLYSPQDAARFLPILGFLGRLAKRSVRIEVELKSRLTILLWPNEVDLLNPAERQQSSVINPPSGFNNLAFAWSF